MYIKGFDHVILRTHTQALHTVSDCVLCRQKDYRNTCGAYVIHQFKPIDSRKHNIQQDQIKGFFFN